MALKLTCPNCGSRPHTEFWFGGELEESSSAAPSGAGTSRTSALSDAGHEADFERVWLRRNSHGIQRERWFHHAGCRRWHTAVRDTRSNEVHEPR